MGLERSMNSKETWTAGGSSKGNRVRDEMGLVSRRWSDRAGPRRQGK